MLVYPGWAGPGWRRTPQEAEIARLARAEEAVTEVGVKGSAAFGRRW